MLQKIIMVVIVASAAVTGTIGLASKNVAIASGAIFLLFGIPYMAFSLMCHRLPYAWTCDWAGTHFPQGSRSFDGCSQHDVCRKCGQKIMQDGQGNWF